MNSHCLIALLCLAGSASARTGSPPQETAAEAGPQPIVLGHSHRIESKVLGEARELRIALPKGYDDSKRRCGVLYLLDGESLFVQGVGAVRHVSENDVLPMIVVGVVNTDRTRDLTPPSGAKQRVDFPSSGGSAKFRRFLIDEVRPYVEGKYRTGAVRLLAGHSFGGLFAAETMLVEPGAYTGYLVLSPSFWWNDYAFVKRFEEVPHDHRMFGAFAWFAIGDEDGPMNGPFERVTWALQQRAPAGFRWARRTFPGEDHWAAALPSLGAGLKEFMAPIRDVAVGVTTFEELKANAAAVSLLLGEELPLGRGPIGDAARRLSKRGEGEASIALLDAAMKAIPDEPYLPFAMSQALGDAERYGEAVKTLEAAIERFSKDPKHEQPVFWLRGTLDEMRSKLAARQGAAKKGAKSSKAPVR